VAHQPAQASPRHLNFPSTAPAGARVVKETENAGCDYRHTMLSAEYPNYGRKMFHIDKLPPLDRDRLIEADKQQYEAWLHRRETQDVRGNTR
jgi:hypothetical protein